jgi:hypothetical protein
MNNSSGLSIWRAIGAIVTALCIYFAISAGHSAYKLHNEVTAAETARPTTFVVDLSTPGTTEATFSQTCVCAHVESILLDSFPNASADLLKGLNGRLQVVDPKGQLALDMSVPSTRMGNIEELSGKVELAYFSPFDKGKYTLRLEVIEPAPALAGYSQQLYARYWLCGLESLPVTLGAGISMITGIFALLVGIPTAIGLKRYGWRRKPTHAH